MLCPSCKTVLIVTDRIAMETMDDHISGTIPQVDNAYTCPNPDCQTKNFFWNRDGEYYTKSYTSNKDCFIDKNPCPFGTISRKLHKEFYSEGRTKTLLKIWKFRFEREYHYDCDYDGNILKKNPKINVWINTKRHNGECLYISGIRMLIFCMKQYHRSRKKNYVYENKLESYDKRWWKVATYYYIKTFEKIFGGIKNKSPLTA